MNKPRLLADAVDKVARKAAGKDWGLYAQLLDHWEEIVGSEYAHLTTPVKIHFPYQPQEAKRKSGVLTIRLPQGLAMEFSFKTDIIKGRINGYLGYEAICRIALEPAVLSPEAPFLELEVDPEAVNAMKEKAAVIENNELREALEQYGEAVVKQKR